MSTDFGGQDGHTVRAKTRQLKAVRKAYRDLQRAHMRLQAAYALSRKKQESYRTEIVDLHQELGRLEADLRRHITDAREDLDTSGRERRREDSIVTIALFAALVVIAVAWMVTR